MEEVQKRRGEVGNSNILLTHIPSQLNRQLCLLHILSCWNAIVKLVQECPHPECRFWIMHHTVGPLYVNDRRRGSLEE